MTDITVGTGSAGQARGRRARPQGARLLAHASAIACATTTSRCSSRSVIVLIALAAICAPLIAPFDPLKTSMVYRLKPIGFRNFVLGTDELGRDMLSRLIYGGRMSLLMGLTPVVLATILGGTLGVIAGFLGGRVNMLIMRTVDIFYALPVGAAGGGDLRHHGRRHEQRPDRADAGLHPAALPHRRDRDDAGAQPRFRRGRARERCVRPGRSSSITSCGNVLAPVFIYASSLISVSILLAAGLSFLGLGVEPPTPDWGLMLSTLRQAIYVQPLVCALPGVAIFITSLSFNLVSDGLRQAMDVRI